MSRDGPGDGAAVQGTQLAQAILTRMVQRRNMPLYLLLGWGVLDLLLFCSQWVLFEQRFRLEFLFTLMLWGQFAALSGWVTIGKEWINASLACIAIGPCWFSLNWLFSGDVLAAVLIVPMGLMALFLYGGMLNLPLVIVREQGWAFRFDPRSQRDAVPFYQFSLREIMIYTLLVAVLAGLWSATRPPPSEEYTWPLRPVADAPFLVLFISALLVPMSIWAAFFWCRPIHGALVAMLVLSYWAVVCMRLVGVDEFALLYATVQPAVLTIHILALQLAGFRFRRVRFGEWTLNDD